MIRSKLGSANSPRPVWDIHLGGFAKIAGHTLEAEGVMDQGKLVVMALDKIPALEISVLFDQFFGSVLKTPLIWPANIVDLTLENSTVFYTYVDGARLGKIQPNLLPPVVVRDAAWIEGEGLYIATSFSFVLIGHSLPKVDANIHAVRGKGFRVQAKLTRDVEFPTRKDCLLKLDGQDGSGGPLISIQSFDDKKSKRGFTLDCDVTLLNAPAIKTEVGISSAGKGVPPNFEANLEYPHPLGPFRNPALDVTWSRKDGFHVQGFPNVHIPDAALDFFKLLKKTGSKAGCAKLADMAMKKGLKLEQHFFASPSITLNRPQGEPVKKGAFYVLINGYYKLSARGHTVVTKDLPQLVLTIDVPASFKFEDLLKLIANTIEKNAEQIVEELWKDKAQLATLMAVFATVEAMKKVGEKAVGKACKELQKLAEKFVKKLGKKLLGSVEGALGEAAGAISSLGGACHHGHHGHHGHSGHHTGRGPTPPPELPAPKVQTKTYQAGFVTVTWDKVEQASGFQTQMFDHDRNLIGSQRLPKGSQRVSFAVDPPKVVSGACFIQIKSLAGPKSPDIDSPFTNVGIVKLASPAITLFELSKGKAQVAWTEIKPCKAYHIQLIDSTGATFDVPGTFLEKTISATVALPPNLAGGPIHVRICASAENLITSDWSKPSRQAVEKLKTPAINQLHFSDGELLASWDHITGAKTYVLDFTNAGGKSVGKPIKVPGAQLSAPVAIAQDLPPDGYVVRVMAEPDLAKAIASEWSTGSSIEKPATVQIKSVKDATGQLDIGLAKDFSQDEFEFAIEKVPTTVIETGFAQAIQKSLLINSATFAAGSYSVKIRRNSASGATIPADWSTSKPFSHKADLGVVHTFTLDTGPLGDVCLNSATDSIYLSLPLTSQNQTGNKIAILDAAKQRLVTTLQVGNSPEAIAINQATNQIGVVNQVDHSLSLVNGSDHKVAATIPLAEAPSWLGINPVSNKAYVSQEKTVASIDLTRPKTKPKSIPVQGIPGCVVVDANRNRIYVASSKVPCISVIDGSTDKVIKTVETPGFATALALNHISGEIFIVYSQRPQLSVLNTQTDKISTPTEIGDESCSFVAVGVNAVANKIYAANILGKSVVVLDGGSLGDMKWVKLDFNPKKLAVNDKTSEIYVVDSQGSSLAVIHDPFPGSSPSQPDLEIGDQYAGGIIFSLNPDGVSGSVISDSDLGSSDWSEAGKLCKAYNGGGFTAWTLPTTQQWDLVLANLVEAGKATGIDRTRYYWTSSSGYGPDWYRAMDLQVHPSFPDRHPIFSGELTFQVRAVRHF